MLPIVNPQRFSLYIGIIFAILLQSCSHERDPRLLQAEAILEMHPDSTLVMLESLDPLFLGSDADRAYHTLLRLEALNMSMRNEDPVALSRTLTGYYIDGKKDPELLPRVYYVLGRMDARKKQYPSALINFRKALRSSRENPDSSLLVRIYAQISGIFCDNKMYRNALAYSREQERLAYNLKDTVAAINAALWIAREYHYLDNPDSVRIVYAYISPMVHDFKHRRYEIWLATQYASFLMDHDEYEKADSIVREADIKISELSPSSVKSVINRLNLHFRRVEDVEKFSVDLLSDSKEAHTLKAAARNLAVINLERGNVGEAINYADRFFNTVDSITKADVSEMVAELAALYSFSETEQDNAELERRNIEIATQRFYLGVAFVGVVVLGIVLWLIVSYRMIRKRKADIEEREEMAKRNEEMMMEREGLLKEKEDLISEREKIMSNLEKVTKDRDNKDQLISAALENADKEVIVKELNMHAHKGGNREKTLRKLRLYLGITYPEFYAALKKLHLSYEEYNDALLIKIGLTVSEATAVLDVDYNTLVNRRFRLARKHNIKEHGFKTWSDYILSLGEESPGSPEVSSPGH